ncbi:MAG: o-succinylbenzoate--CoA ligase [Deltaproteobacteria bacterium]|nr:o-succinylbenzoate--CoA ligase [Deltaproteobacteria bacterium]MBW2361567.1 o-succinylbenzoate--CoA ligase [Deltaproteobacteria bacterium]
MARAPWLEPSNRPALGWQDEAWTARELAGRADALAGWLRNAGVRRGDVVAAHLPGGGGFATLLHALDRCDAILLPLNRRHKEAELRASLEHAGAKLVLHGDDELAERVRRATRGRPVRPLPDLPASAEVLRPEGDTSTPALLLYTSGTTGQAKGALLCHANLRASVDASAGHLGTAPDDRWLACLPLHHIGGLSILLRCAAQGCEAVLHSEFDAEAVSEALDTGRITHVSLVPTMLTRLLALRGIRHAPETLRVVLLGGSGASSMLLERAAQLGWPIAATYGLTEAASQVATRLPGSAPDAALPALPGVALRIVDADGEEAAPGVVGEILVRGANVMQGYWNAPQASAAALDGDWLHTGDLGALDERGDLRVFDRRADLIVSGGENVYPAEIESVLSEHPDIAAAGVSAVRDAEFGQRPVAWIVATTPEPPSAEALRAFCRERLAGFKVPLRFHSVDELPCTAAGKLQRHRLQEPAGTNREARPPHSPIT